MSKREKRHTDLNGLIDLDNRSIMRLGGSAVVSIPSAEELGITDNAHALQAAVSVRCQSKDKILIEARVDLSDLEDIQLDIDN